MEREISLSSSEPSANNPNPTQVLCHSLDKVWMKWRLRLQQFMNTTPLTTIMSLNFLIPYNQKYQNGGVETF